MSDKSNNQPSVQLEKTIQLNRDFSVPTYAEWKELAEANLKGAPFEKKLVTRTHEGISLQPIYCREDLEGLSYVSEFPGSGACLRGTRASGYLQGGWEIAQETVACVPDEVNRELKAALVRGQNAATVNLSEPVQTGRPPADRQAAGAGIMLFELKDMETAFAGIDWAACPLHLDSGFSALVPAMLLQAMDEQGSGKLKEFRGSLNADPLGYLVKEGELPVSAPQAFAEMARVVRWAAEHAPRAKSVGVSGVAYHEAGADAVSELGFVLATAVEYMDRLLDQGLTIEQIAGQFRFSFGTGTQYFTEIAKLRAARICWARILQAFGAQGCAGRLAIHARSDNFSQTVFDPHVNLLRTATETFSAVIGGADSIHAGPFDEAFAVPDEFSRRIARNTQIILGEESHLGELIDPAGGSYYVEHLTSEMAQKAWQLFQEIEAMGGMFRAVQNGFVQQRVTQTAAARLKDAGRRRQVIVGTNMYANPAEQVSRPETETKGDMHGFFNRPRKSVPQNIARSTGEEELISQGAAALAAGADLFSVTETFVSRDNEAITVEKLLPLRISAAFEELRFACQEHSKSEAGAPAACLINMGAVNQYKARADFSRGFFECGGFRVETTPGFSDIQSAVKAVETTGSGIGIICSSDEKYREMAGALAEAIKKVRPDFILVLAGRPGDMEDEYRSSGIDEFIYLGVNAHATLSGILEKMGVKVK